MYDFQGLNQGLISIMRDETLKGPPKFASRDLRVKNLKNTAVAQAAGTVDGKQFFRQARSRLSYEAGCLAGWLAGRLAGVLPSCLGAPAAWSHRE